MIFLSALNAQENEAKNLCDQEIMKEQPHRELVEKYCTQAGEYFQGKKNNFSASWYYLLGGQNDKNIDEIQSVIAISATYSYIGHSYILKGQLNKAKKLYSTFLKKFSVLMADKAIQDHYKLLRKLYPKQKENLKQGLALWNDIYAPLKSVKTLYANFEKASKEKKYKEAIKYLTLVIALQKKYQDKNNINLWGNLLKLGILYNQNKQYKKSLKIFQQVEPVYKTRLANNKRFDYLFEWIADDYKKLKKYDNALSYYKKSLNVQEKTSGKEHVDTAISYTNLSLIYRATGDYLKALEHSQKALTIREKILGKEHVDTAISYYDMGVIYQTMHQYPKALNYYKKSLTIIEKVLGNEHPDTATNYKSIGFLYKKLGDHPKALNYYQKSLAIREKVLGKEHPGTAQSYNNIGGLYYKVGDYSKALNYYQKSLAIREKVLGKEHPDTAQSYNNVSGLYYKMGDYTKALNYYQKSLTIIEKVLGKEHPDTAIIYNNIGLLYQDMGDYPEALNYNQKSLAIREKVLGKEHPGTVTSYNNIGLLYYKMEDNTKALNYCQKSLSITEKVLGKEHPNTATIYNNIGFLYKDMGDYTKALNYYQKSLAITEKVLGKEHPDTATIYNNIGLLYQDMEDYTKAHRYAKLSFDIFLKNRNKVFTIFDSQQKEKYLKSTSGYVALLLDTSIKYLTQLNKEKKITKAQELQQSGANAWLNYKGSIFDSENAIAMLYSSTKDKKLKAKIDDLISSKRYLARLYQSLPKPKEKEAWKSNIKKTEDKIAKLTNQIASKATNFKEQQGLKSIGHQDITSHLKDNELYIDYAKAGGHYYLFSLDHQENICFIQIDKNSTKKIDGLVKAFREDINIVLKDNTITDEKLKTLTESSKAKLSKLYEIIIQKPLGETIKDKTSLIISPDGALRLLPFETLYSKESDKYFIEEKEIRYIPSGKELVRLYKYSKDKVSIDKRSAVIFANPNFDSDLNSSKREPIPITPNTSRTAIIKPLFMIEFPPLPGTKAEAKAIKSTFAEGSTIEYLQDDATESNLTKVKQPNILHIATHGFFINDNTIPNPMLKSGIALTGANKSRIKGVGDGIVTALKLSGLDLKGTDLVVLSACQTGVVDINSTDSVSGLSKAFIQAGAKDIVMSLWSVDDEATKELMTSFYQEMKENKNYAKALKAAKLKMIEEGRHPFYWGAFVVSGL